MNTYFIRIEQNGTARDRAAVKADTEEEAHKKLEKYLEEIGYFRRMENKPYIIGMERNN